MKRSISEGDLSSSSKKSKHRESEDLESDLAPPPIRCSISDGEETDTDHDAEYPIDVVNLESAMVNPPPNISPAVRVFKLNLVINKPDPKVYLDEAWKFLKPSAHMKRTLTISASLRFTKGMWGIYISTTLESLAVHCNDDDDDDPSLLLLPLEKFWLEYGEKFKLICSIGGVQGRIKFLERKVWDLGFELLPTKLFLASQVRDKVRTSVLLLITDQRQVCYNLSLLKNLMLMLNGSVSRELRFLEKPFLDSTAEFYAAEAKQVLEQSSGLPHYLKHIDVPFLLFPTYVGCCVNVYFPLSSSTLELLGVHACAILEKGFEKLMDERPWEALRMMCGHAHCRRQTNERYLLQPVGYIIDVTTWFQRHGTSIDMEVLFREWPNVLTLLAGLIVIKTLIITALGPRVGLTLQESVRIGFLLSQGGEFAFVVFSLANRLGVLPLELNKLLIIVVVLSMALTPTLNQLGRKAADFILDVKKSCIQHVAFDIVCGN
ncbi:hypothetical protein F2Q69_00000709 [Brassica cretica]|uniref:Cation/H+ exchanger domain-containing protein n=1 Tax=Brassica cretica TaxID=69181 RepID=A0A8S9PGS2_BRACR|nr:hypothetical protein F2Q69_00000709 [Brassica cretica]